MHHVGTKAEDSSLKNQFDQPQLTTHHSNKTSNESNDSPYDDKRQNVKNGGSPALVATSENSTSQDVEKGILRRTVTRETHTSAITAPYDEKDDFPEGGLKAWSVVLGAFCGSFSVFGIINSTAVLMDHFKEHQLKEYNEAQLGWIFGLALFLTFFCKPRASVL